MHIRSVVAPIAAAVAYLTLTVLHLRLISACLVSFTGSFALAVVHPRTIGTMLASDQLEYWIAGIAWCAASAFIIRAIVSPPARRAALLPSAARMLLTGFVFIAFTAPIISPLPPLEQGVSLQHDRFLSPMSIGICWESLPPPPPSPADAGLVERITQSADHYLLRRTTQFTGALNAGTPPAAIDRGAAVTRSSIYFVMGTDGVGRDLFSRLVYGTRYSLGIGCLVVLISLTLGSGAGMLAGYAGGAIDAVIMRVVDVLFSIPSLILVLMLMAFIGQSLGAMIVVLSATGWMGSARLLRAEVMHLRAREFISASRLLGTTHADILRLHIVPNMLPTMKNAGIMQLGNIILAEASLSFLGLGIQQPSPSWGNMIADSMGYGGAAPFTALFPAIALSVLIISVNIVGEQTR